MCIFFNYLGSPTGEKSGADQGRRETAALESLFDFLRRQRGAITRCLSANPIKQLRQHAYLMRLFTFARATKCGDNRPARAENPAGREKRKSDSKREDGPIICTQRQMAQNQFVHAYVRFANVKSGGPPPLARISLRRCATGGRSPLKVDVTQVRRVQILF